MQESHKHASRSGSTTPMQAFATHPEDSTHPRSTIATQSAGAGARVIAVSAGSASARHIRPSDIDVLTWVPLVKIPSGEVAIASQAEPSSIQVTEDSQDISWEGIIHPVCCWLCKTLILLILRLSRMPWHSQASADFPTLWPTRAFLGITSIL